MAALLVRAFDLEPTAAAGFADIEGNTHATDIDALAAGGRHSCAIRSDGAATCWGHNYYGQSDAPDGTFEAIAAGNRHTCALRTDNTITCWGSNYISWVWWSDPPKGTFKAVTAGNLYACGLRSDHTVTCWGGGERGPVETVRRGDRDGTFKAISAGWNHACGLRTDDTVECWGDDQHDQADPPDGTFKAVTAGSAQTCGVRSNGTIECWGRDHYGSTDPPEGRFIDIAAGPCRVRSDLVVCAGVPTRSAPPIPSVPALAASQTRSLHLVGLGVMGGGAGYGPQKCDHTASALAGPMPLTASSSERLENG